MSTTIEIERQSAEEATIEFKKLLEEGYFRKDRSSNTAEDYSLQKEDRDHEAAMSYADSEEFRQLCIEEGFLNT